MFESVFLPEAGNSTARATEQLQNALKLASQTESLALLPLIERAATLTRDIRALASAVQSDANS